LSLSKHLLESNATQHNATTRKHEVREATREVRSMELSQPGNQILEGNHQLYNVIITAHALCREIFYGDACNGRRVWQLVRTYFDRCPGYGIPRSLFTNPYLVLLLELSNL
jgi:hypothetical protein